MSNTISKAARVIIEGIAQTVGRPSPTQESDVEVFCKEAWSSAEQMTPAVRKYVKAQVKVLRKLISPRTQFVAELQSFDWQHSPPLVTLRNIRHVHGGLFADRYIYTAQRFRAFALNDTTTFIAFADGKNLLNPQTVKKLNSPLVAASKV